MLWIPLLFTLHADSSKSLWQRAEIVSIKEDVFADGPRTAYVYTLRARDVSYRAAFDRPLEAAVHSIVKFTVEKKSLCVQDSNGRMRRAAIVEQISDQPHH